jgi:hypothetical protein
MPTRDPFWTGHRPRPRFGHTRRTRVIAPRHADCLRSSRRLHIRRTFSLRVCSERIRNAMDRLAAAMIASVHLLATSWVKGVTLYGLAMHGYVPDSSLCDNSPSTDDQKESAHESNGGHDGALSSFTIGHAEAADAFSSRSSAAVPPISAVSGAAGQRCAVTAAPRLPLPPYDDRD